MRLGVCDKKGNDWIGFIENIDNHIFSHVELYVNNVDKDSFIFQNTYLDAVLDAATKKEVSLSLHCLMGINLGEKIGRIRNASIEILSDVVKAAEHLGALWVTTHMGTAGLLNSDKKKESRLQFVSDAIYKIASQNNCCIGIENAFCVPDNVRPVKLGDKPKEIEFLLSNLESRKNVGLVLDFGHAKINLDSFNSYCNRLLNKIIAVHFHWNNGECDSHLPFTSNEFDEFAKYIPAFNQLLSNNIPILVECNNMEDSLVTAFSIKQILEDKHEQG